eukprot:TRINITY_DN5285_c0_g1_i1.p1 TRINITY_DN5285_c0_g1~~TRINITY_DN5285_c0_g1_i1.p1  ORF type:complete len:336 (+),score=80.17 TRINITY_DN5285_c0_g1_i1:205-1212(+)
MAAAATTAAAPATEREPPEIVLIGGTGYGKSALANKLTGSQNFRESPNPTPETQLTTGFLGSFEGVPVFVIDTPGQSDTETALATHVTAMVEYLKTRPKVRGIAILLNLHHPRLDEPVKRMLRLFWRMFPLPQFWQHVALVFSHSYTYIPTLEQEKRTKREQYAPAVAQVIVEASGGFQGQQMQPPACYFVDSTAANDPQTNGEIRSMLGWLQSLPPLKTHGDIVQPNTQAFIVTTEKREREVSRRTVQIFRTESHYGGSRRYWVAGPKHHWTTQEFDHNQVIITMVEESRERREDYSHVVSYSDWTVIRTNWSSSPEKPRCSLSTPAFPPRTLR